MEKKEKFGVAGKADINARTEKELREKLEALLGELEGFEIHATIVLHKDGATKEDNDRLTRVLDKWQEQEKTHSPETACNKMAHK